MVREGLKLYAPARHPLMNKRSHLPRSSSHLLVPAGPRAHAAEPAPFSRSCLELPSQRPPPLAPVLEQMRDCGLTVAASSRTAGLDTSRLRSLERSIVLSTNRLSN